MKKVLLLMMVALLAGACSLNQDNTENNVKVINVISTDDPAVNAAIPLFSEQELQIMGLAEGDAVVEANTVYSAGRGPLFDNRGVKGKTYSFSIYPSDTNKSYVVKYGFSADAVNQTVNATNVYSSWYARISIPANAPGQIFWKVVDSDGIEYLKEGQLYNAFLYDTIVSYSYSESYHTSINDGIYINYSGPSTGAGMLLHFGWNSWNQVSDVAMDWITNSSYSYASDYATARVQLPTDAEYLDFAIFGNGIWDNNQGQDFHTSVRPLVTVQPNSTYKNYNGDIIKTVSISYANGDLGDTVWAHYGVNGWQNVAEAQCYPFRYNGYVSAVYSQSVTVSVDASVFDVAFRNNSGDWENNFGQDWHTDISWR